MPDRNVKSTCREQATFTTDVAAYFKAKAMALGCSVSVYAEALVRAERAGDVLNLEAHITTTKEAHDGRKTGASQANIEKARGARWKRKPSSTAGE